MRRAAIAGALVAAAIVLAVPAGGGASSSAPSVESAKALTLKAQRTRFGVVLFDGRGQVLYGFTRDRRGEASRCYGDCATAWPVYFATATVRAGAGVKQALIGKSRRRGGRFQVTYNGWPLYFYAHEGPGEVKCQNIVTHGGTWLVVRPSGKLVR